MKKFFAEFKAFISRGNIIDMAVGVIIGSAFSAIVTALTNQILMPLINWAIGGTGGLSAARTILGTPAYTGELDELGRKIIDWSATNYIDWGKFITAIIDFLLIALVLFIVLKIVMKSSQLLRSAATAVKPKLTKEDKKAMKEQGLDTHDKVAVQTYLDDKQKKADEAKAEADAKAKAEEEEKYRNSTEGLLKEILATLKEQGEEKKPAKKTK